MRFAVAIALALLATPLMAQGIAVLVLLALVIVSYVILRPVSDEPVPRLNSSQMEQK